MREYTALTTAQRRLFAKAVTKMVNDLRAGIGFRSSLRIKAVQGHTSIFEMTWDIDGRATLAFGDEQQPGEAHVLWRRIGGHDILKNP
jgi:hypothetical protein